MIDQPPEALVRGCNDPIYIGVLSDWIEEQYGSALDYNQSGWAGCCSYGVGYGNMNTDFHSGNYGDGHGFGFGYYNGCGNGNGQNENYGFWRNGDGFGYGYGYGNGNGEVNRSGYLRK